MLSIFSIILRHKKAVVLLTLAGFAVSAVISLIVPPRYVSGASFLPVGVEEEIAGRKGFFSQLGAFGEVYGVFLRLRRNFFIDYLIRSHRMSELLDARFDLKSAYGVDTMDEVREELRQRTSVEVRDEGVIVITVQDRYPKRAKELVEAYIDKVDSLLIEFTIENALARKRFLEQEVERRERRLAAADSSIRAFFEEHGIFEVEQQARAAMKVASRLEGQLQAVRIEKELLEMTMRPGSPELDRLERMLEKLEDHIAAVREGGGSELFPPLREIPGLASEYLRLYGEIEMQQFALGFIRIKLEDEAILSSKEVNVIRVIDPPVVPERRVWPKRKQIVLISTFATFFWVCFGLLVRDRWREGEFALHPPGPGPDHEPGGGSSGRVRGGGA